MEIIIKKNILENITKNEQIKKKKIKEKKHI